MPTVRRRRPARASAAVARPLRWPHRGATHERGQALVEFAGVALPLLVILLGIIQSGFLFGGYVGISNAAREGARAGTIYEYDAAQGQGQNDLLRCQAILAATQQAVDDAVPGDFSGSCTTVLGGGDLVIAYPDSATCTNSARTGCQIRVTVTFRQPLLIPFVGTFIGTDDSNRIPMSADVTMVIN